MASKTLPAKPAKKPALRPLSIVEKTFLEHYLRCNFNASEAARRMGVKGEEGGKHPSNPGVRGYEILRRSHVQAHLEIMRSELPKQFPDMVEKALRTYNDILDSDRRDFVDDQGRFVGIKALTFEQASCIRKIKFDAGVITELEFESKKAAADAVLDKLGSPVDRDQQGNQTAVPATVIINVQGQPLDQSFRVLSLEEQGITEE